MFDFKDVALVQDINGLFHDVTLYPASRALASRCQRLLEDMPDEFDLERRGPLLRIVAAFLDYEFKNARPRKSKFIRMGAGMRRVFDTLTREEILTLPVTKLAKKFNCTRRTSRACSISSLAAPLPTRMELRLLQAASLLRNPELKCIEVARRCGFNHRGLFNECFKHRFGLTPTQWQAQAASRPRVGLPNPKSWN